MDCAVWGLIRTSGEISRIMVLGRTIWSHCHTAIYQMCGSVFKIIFVVRREVAKGLVGKGESSHTTWPPTYSLMSMTKSQACCYGSQSAYSTLVTALHECESGNEWVSETEWEWDRMRVRQNESETEWVSETEWEWDRMRVSWVKRAEDLWSRSSSAVNMSIMFWYTIHIGG